MNQNIPYSVFFILLTIFSNCDKKYKEAPELLTLKNTYRDIQNEYSDLAQDLEKHVALGRYIPTDSALLIRVNRLIESRKQINFNDTLLNSYIDLVYDEYYKEKSRMFFDINPDQINRIRSYWKKFKTDSDTSYYYYAMLEIVQIESDYVIALFLDLTSEDHFSMNVCKSQDTVKLGTTFSVVLILRDTWINWGITNKLEQKHIQVRCDGIKQEEAFYFEKLGDAYIIKIKPRQVGNYTIDLPIFSSGLAYTSSPHNTPFKTRFYAIN